MNSRQILVNDPTGPQIEMADFRVAHLSFRQAHIASACAQFGAWIIPVELVMKWSPLFSALGHPEAFRNYLVCWRRPFPCPACPNPRLCCWRRHAPEPRFNVSCSFGDELFKGFRRSRPGGRCDRDCDW